LNSQEAFFRGEIRALKNAHREEKKRIATELDIETKKLIEEREVQL
jgi:hypothetical protein